MTLALVALLILVLGMLVWRAVTRERRDYARFKRMRATGPRREVMGRWIRESLLVLGGLAGVVLLAAWPYVPQALRDARESPPLGLVPDATAGIAVIVAAVVLLAVMIVPVLLVRGQIDEIPAVGDIRAILPRNRGELPYGAGLGLTAGVVEELLFRLALPALLFGIIGNGLIAFSVAAVLFGMLHLYQGALGMLFATVLGVVFTVFYVLSGSILLPIVLHALIDLRSLVLIPAVLGGAWTARATPTTARP